MRVVWLAIAAQALNPPPREMIDLPRSLTPAEVAAVMAASRDALAGKTFRLRFGANRGPELVMGAAGRPRWMRTTMGYEAGWVGGTVNGDPIAPPPQGYRWHEDVIQITDYTGQPARRCDGTVDAGELIVEYEHKSSTNAWTATASAQLTPGVRTPGYAPLFNILSGITAVTSGARQQIGDRPARGFVAEWKPPIDTGLVEITDDPAPPARGPASSRIVQTLWIDTSTLLPLRWEVVKPGVPAYGFDIVYEPVDIQPPPGVRAPDCIR